MNMEQFWLERAKERKELFSSLTPRLVQYWNNKYRSISINDYSDIEYVYPTQLSNVRDCGYSIWDSISNYSNALDMRMPIRMIHTVVTPTKEVDKQNYVWNDYSYTAKRKNYIDTSQPVAHIDFNTTINGIYGYKLYEAAHVLTHMWADPQSLLVRCKNRSYVYKKFFNIAVTSILLSEVYNVPIYVKESDFSKNWIVPSAIKIQCITEPTYADPLFLLKRTDIYNIHNFDNTLACGFFIIYNQGQPSEEDIKKGHNCILFSMGPMRVLFAGWDTYDNIYQSTPSIYNKRYKKTGITVCPEDLLSPIDFTYYTSLFQNVSSEYMLIRDWINTEEYKSYRDKTPPLPCRTCLDLLPNIEGFPNKIDAYANEAEYKKVRTNVFKDIRSYTILTETNIAGFSDKNKKYIYNTRSHRTTNWKNKMSKLRNKYKAVKQLLTIF